MIPLLKSRFVPLVVAVIVFTIIFAIGLWLALEREKQTQERETKLIERAAHSFVHDIEQRLNSAVMISEVLASQIVLSGPEAVTAKFDHLSASLLREDIHDQLVIGLAPDAIITDIYPNQHKQFLGLNLNTEPARRDDAARAVALRNLVISGLYDLAIGGRGFVARKPVFLSGDGKADFWGLVTVAMPMNYLVPIKTLEELASTHVVLRLSTIDHRNGQEATLLNTGLDTQQSTQQLIAIPGGNWRLETAAEHNRQPFVAGLLWIFLSALLIATTAGLIVRYPQRLKDQVRQKTVEIETHDQFLNDLIDSLPVGIVVTDTQTRIRYRNQLFDELMPKAVSNDDSLINLLEQSVVNPNMRQFLISRISLNDLDFDVMVQLADDRHFQLNCSQVTRAQGSILVWVFRDVSDITRINRTLRHVSATRADMLRLIPDPMVFFNKQGDMMETNPGFQALFADYADLVAGFSCADLERVLFQKTTSKASFQPVSQLGSVSGSQAVFTDEFVMPGTHERVFERTTCFDNSSNTVGSIMHFRDVTDAHEVDRMKTEFLSTAAHELRTPLANIFGYTELLIKARFDKTRQTELLNIIYSQTKRLSLIIDDLLDLARIESRAGEAFNYDWFELGELLEAVTREFEIELAQYDFQLEIEQNGSHIWCDADKIEQVVENLLSNAIKYSEPGSRITLKARRDNQAQQEAYLITLSDEGIGMTDKDLAHVFERFYRADTSGQIPGTGLGMAIVREIVLHHQGRIDIDSQPGKGTSVSIWLPEQQVAGNSALELSYQQPV